MPSQLVKFDSVGTFTFTVPANVYVIWKTGIAGGAGGGSWPGGPGGAGGMCFKIPIVVTPGEIVTVIVGDKGLGAAATGAGDSSTAYTGTPGGDTQVKHIVIEGGKSIIGDTRGGWGGGAIGDQHPDSVHDSGSGGPSLVPNTPGMRGRMGANGYWGGSGGAGHGGAGLLDGAPGHDEVNNIPGGEGGGPYISGIACGGGAASTMFGQGGKGGNSQGHYAGFDAVASHFGAGGGGATIQGSSLVTGLHGKGGDGAAGFAWLEYIGNPY